MNICDFPMHSHRFLHIGVHSNNGKMVKKKNCSMLPLSERKNFIIVIQNTYLIEYNGITGLKCRTRFNSRFLVT